MSVWKWKSSLGAIFETDNFFGKKKGFFEGHLVKCFSPFIFAFPSFWLISAQEDVRNQWEQISER